VDQDFALHSGAQRMFSVKYLGLLATIIIPHRCLKVIFTEAVIRNDIYRRLA
jgi:hypothetical protein